MKRWLSHLTIVSYLGFLLVGIVAHTLNWGTGVHPVMYYSVWDMFCGWAAYETRYHIVGEGVSGNYYELSPGPWGELQPYGRLGRRHYDPNALFTLKLAFNTLRHTQHEPMARIMVIEETWNRKYNLPDWIWAQRWEKPKEKYSYFRVRDIMTPDGALLARQQAWVLYQTAVSLSANPRLQADSHRNTPFLAVDGLMPISDDAAMLANGQQPLGSPSGN